MDSIQKLTFCFVIAEYESNSRLVHLHAAWHYSEEHVHL